MSSMEPLVVTKRESGRIFAFEVKSVPVQLVNAIRRILLNETPVVELQDIVIKKNTTDMPYEVLRHRIEMLPVNVRPSEAEIIEKSKVELRIEAEDKDQHMVTTDDFVVNSSRPDLLMKEPDSGTPCFVLKTKKGDAVHIEARLGVNPVGSQVCLATYSYHIDPERVLRDRKVFIESNPDIADAERVFNNSQIQRSFHTNARGRPDWFDVKVETLGVISARELVLTALKVIQQRTKAWADQVREKIIRNQEENVYTFVSNEGHTIGALLDYVIYDEPGLVKVKDYDVPHPLRQEMKIRVLTDKPPEEIIDFCVKKVTEYCTQLEKEL